MVASILGEKNVVTFGFEDVEQIQHCLDRWHAGDERAKNELIGLTRTRLRFSASILLEDSPVVPEQTDDLLQEATLSLSLALDKVRPTDARHFVNLAAMHLDRRLVDMARKYQGPKQQIDRGTMPRVKAGLDESGNSTFDPPDPTDGPPTAEELTELHQAVDKLSDGLQEVFRLHYYAGMSFSAIAKTVRRAKNTVMDEYKRA